MINVDFATGTLSAGGIASARANDNSKITLTGSGTFAVFTHGSGTGIRTPNLAVNRSL